MFITYLACETIIKFTLNDINMFYRTHTLVPGHFIPRYTVNLKVSLDNVKNAQKVLRVERASF